jgi:hypothetical protein
MCKCKNCNKEFDKIIYINGKRKDLKRRKYCLDCCPFGDFSASQRLNWDNCSIEIGKTYGFLEIMEEVKNPNINDSQICYRCKCSCGKIVIKSKRTLRSTKNGCGCAATNRRIIDVTEKVCKICNINKEINKFTSHLMYYKNLDNTNRSVRYYHHTCISCEVFNKQQKIFTNVSYKYSEIKNSCYKSKVDFLLTLEEFSTFWDKKCHYCSGDRKTHGLDRMDNDGPYSIQNCVACCKDCNFMKRTMGYTEFLDKITKIYKNFNRT